MEDDELILHKFGQKLQQLRKNQSLTLQELEAIVDIDNSNLSKYVFITIEQPKLIRNIRV